VCGYFFEKRQPVKRKIRILCGVLCAALLLLTGCSGRSASGYRIVYTYDTEGSYVLAFREGDKLCPIISAAMQELAANGTLKSTSLTWFNENLISLKGQAGAMDSYRSEVTSRTLIVGIDTNNMPMSYTDGTNYRGFDIDVANYICGYLGWSMSLQPISADDVEVQLNSGNIDCAMGVPVSDMQDGLDYSPSYLSSKYVLVTRSDSGITTKSGLHGKVLGALVADLSVLKSDDKFISKLDHITYQTGTSGLFSALDAGDVDGILVSSAIAAYYMK